MLREEFWSKTAVTAHPDDCWEWQRSRNPTGHGRVTFKGSQGYEYSHRVAWQLVNGAIPDGFVVCHACDNPPCCNPSHLFLGTLSENCADKVAKNRQAKGNNFPFSKLNPKLVREIRALAADGLTCPEIARRIGHHRLAVRKVLTGQTWRHVT